MSDKFSILPLRHLLRLTLNSLDNKKSFFSIPEELFFIPKKNDKFRLNQFEQLLESPIGVAAGPHTQLAQNIVAAWLCGARFIELKTIQTLDELDVSKPCIDMQDEGYNCEWSQELKIKESFDQYLNAWIIIHILKDKLNLDSSEPGVIFNMSVGYNYEGILKENVQWYFKKMADSSVELNKKIEEIKDIYPNVKKLKINSQISDNITLSTMHGCPPEEIEQIGKYLITEKKLHTAVKLNPTLLGEKELRNIICNSGFETVVPDIAFEHDLKYEAAKGIIIRLQKLADINNVHFSLKLTNTLESENNKDVFPSQEKMMYASGRLLHPISINLARKLQNDFDGELNISFSGGADAFNISDIVNSGLYPVTVCSDILKPGGYGKLNQYIENLSKDISSEFTDSKRNSWNKLKTYSEEVLENERYKKTSIRDKSIKTNRELGNFDCIHAPCVDNCPTHQDIPNYIYHTANGDFDKAYEVIMKTNPFPHTTGMVCDHLCQMKCTRINYDDPLLIRDIKRFVAENANTKKLNKINTNETFSNKSIGIIGAGPAGLSCAKFLKLAGFDVSVFEEKQRSGGMISNAIPAFRLEMESLLEDVKKIEDLGIEIQYGKKIDKPFFEELRKENDFVFIATGAQKVKKINLEGQDSLGVIDPLKFLFDVKDNKKDKIGKHVLIVGGGNTAMDAARTAKRLVDKGGSVTIVYRRTIKQMPADFGEIIAVQEEGVKIIELVSPVKINSENGRVKSMTCEKMKLGKKDESGRERPVVIPETEFELKADSIILATGQDIAIDFIGSEKLKTKPNSYEIQLPNVFIGGDAMRGGSTVINAVGDGRNIANEILEKLNIEVNDVNTDTKKDLSVSELILKKSKTVFSEVEIPKLDEPSDFSVLSKTMTREEVIKEASRCLYCDEICNICTTLCPNLALFPYDINEVKYSLDKLVLENGNVNLVKDRPFEIKQKHQILVIGDWCNECGNCNTFCPTSGAPYKEKPHLFLNKNAFNENNEGYYFDTNEKNKIHYKKDDQTFILSMNKDVLDFKINEGSLQLDVDNMSVLSYDLKTNENCEIELTTAAQMRIILQGAQQI